MMRSICSILFEKNKIKSLFQKKNIADKSQFSLFNFSVKCAIRLKLSKLKQKMIICHLPAIFKLKQNFFIAFLCFACHLIRIIISLFQLFLIYDTYFLPSRGFATIFLIIINHILLLIVFFLEHLLYTNSNRHCICKQCDDEIQGPCCNLGRFICYSFPILPICWCSSHLTRVSMFTFT